MGRRIALAGAVVAVVCLGLWLGFGLLREEHGPGPAAQRPAADPRSDVGTSANPAPGGDATRGERSVLPGGRLALPLAELPPGPVVVNLRLEDPLPADTPLPARIVGENGQVFDLEGRIAGGDRRSASFEIDASELSPGLYMVQVETGRTHFPVQRFVLEVR